MKRRIFLVCPFYCFFRLPIYESVAAIFWQSASYVCVLAIKKRVPIFVKKEYLYSKFKREVTYAIIFLEID